MPGPILAPNIGGFVGSKLKAAGSKINATRGFARRGRQTTAASSQDFSGNIRPGSVQILSGQPGQAPGTPPTRGQAAIDALRAQYGGALVSVRPDGLFQVDLGKDGVLFYDVNAAGDPFQVKDPEAKGTGGGGGASASQALDQASFIRDVLSSGRDFLTAAALTRGFNPQRAPITQADMIAGLGGGGSLPSLANLTGPNGFQTSPTAAGAPPAGGGFFPLRTQADISQLSQETAPPAVRSTIGGNPVPEFKVAVPLPSPSALGQLTADETGALNTALLAEKGITAEELAAASQRRYLGGRGFRTGAMA